jgi:hypothetical protein
VGEGSWKEHVDGPPNHTHFRQFLLEYRKFPAGLIRELVANGWHPVIAAPDADVAWAVARGAEAIEIAIDRSGVNPIRDALAILFYYKLMRRIRPKIFLGFTAKPNIYGSIAATACGIQTLPNVSGLGTAFINPGPLSALVGALYRIAFRKCSIVFFQNPDDIELFVGRRIVRREQARLLPGSGVDLDHFSPAPPSKGILFLFVGRLLGDKGVRSLLKPRSCCAPAIRIGGANCSDRSMRITARQ